MATTKNTPKNRAYSAAKLELKTFDCYDRMVSEIASLKCVLNVLEVHDLSGGRCGQIASAELVLRETIDRLDELSGDVENLKDAAIAREVANV